MNRLTYEEYRNLWDLVARKPFLTGFPLHLDVELTSRCNLRCEMCFQRHLEERRSDMPLATFKKLVDEGAREGLCAMKLQSRGESLLHRDLVECLAYAKEKGILDVHITTNGLLLKEPMIRDLVEAGLDLLILSVDPFHQEASGKSRKEYIEFIQRVIRIVHEERKRVRESRLKIRIQTCVEDYAPENIKDLETENRRLFPEADLVLINPVYSSHEDAPHLSELGRYRFHPCSYLWQRLTIYADGQVTTCSRDYNCKFNRIGSVDVSSIRELWHSPVMRDLRARHLTGRRREFHICGICENYLIHKKTGHPGAGCTGTVYDLEES
ncbi:hypothetical protein D3OALGA1CA_422 [Olavius algarvensis associated proteobacterium Delta 3]|nr:hypothetical protein D3OALGA1CA_422 [Olavius algarvensis associated proteobacterium Delta 3]CAB5114019.1 hypothetical protein D3OALGB2SA_2564 [Olavius algarvensis associated proteobacterium Delta 3]